MHASSLSGILLILLLGFVISIVSVLVFFATMPPWHGPGNDFAPFFYIMSIAGFFVGPIMLIGGWIGVRRARSEFHSRIENVGMRQDAIRNLDKQTLKIGIGYLPILIGAFFAASYLLMIALLVMVPTYATNLLFVFTFWLAVGLGPVALGLFIQEWGWKTANAITNPDSSHEMWAERVSDS